MKPWDKVIFRQSFSWLITSNKLGSCKMRKSRQETAETRERIVHNAAHEFGQHGIAETGLADVMSAAGLTHGGFYKHFDSKDQLVAEAIQNSLNSISLTMAKAQCN